MRTTAIILANRLIRWNVRSGNPARRVTRVRLRPCHTPHVKAAARRLDEAADLMPRELLGMATQVQTPRYKIDTAVYSR